MHSMLCAILLNLHNVVIVSLINITHVGLCIHYLNKIRLPE